jgi:FkbM family methyltransferase
MALHIPNVLPMIESTLFVNPEIIEHKVGQFLAKTTGNLYVDIGACAGRYVILLGEQYTEVIAVEPEPHNMHRLRRNVNWSGLTNVQFLQCAIAEQDGYSDFYLGLRPDNHSLVYRFNQRKGRLSTRQKVVIPTMTLSSIVKDRLVDLVKVDVEGAEFSVLKGAEPSIENIKRWIVELHDAHMKTALEDWFQSHHYTIRWIDRNHLYAWSNN